MATRLLGRQFRYDRLERYATGNHDLPNGDKRFVVALRELQRKCRTNYCELIIKAVTQRMRITGFQFGPDQQVDEEAKAIWYYNDMDVQSPVLIEMSGTFGDAYIMVTPPDPDEPGSQSGLSVEDPRMCIVEDDPRRLGKTLAGLKMWMDDVDQLTKAILYTPDAVYEYEGPAVTDAIGTDTVALTHKLISKGVAAGGFRLVSVQPNTMGEVPLIRVPWMPSFGTMSRSEHESVIDIQDRINHTILDRLVIAKSQAYNQRWMTGGTGREDFKPGSDMVWATQNSDANFGQFDAADLTQILAAVRDDVGDMAAVSQTPATYLMNRMVNVSGDTLTQDQSALVMKISDRQEAVGWALAKAMRLAFLAAGNPTKAKETEVCTLWKNAQIYQLAELGDSFSKFTSGGVPIEMAMQLTGLFTNDQILEAKKQFDEQQQMQMDMQQQSVDHQGTAVKNQVAAKAAMKPKAATPKTPSK
jgi:hypothetical protein